jgi:hypothetical protein
MEDQARRDNIYKMLGVDRTKFSSINVSYLDRQFELICKSLNYRGEKDQDNKQLFQEILDDVLKNDTRWTSNDVREKK